jgi:hypothetical protein
MAIRKARDSKKVSVYLHLVRFALSLIQYSSQKPALPDLAAMALDHFSISASYCTRAC